MSEREDKILAVATRACESMLSQLNSDNQAPASVTYTLSAEESADLTGQDIMFISTTVDRLLAEAHYNVAVSAAFSHQLTGTVYKKQ